MRDIPVDANSEVTFLSGVDDSGMLALTSFASWNGDRPATYSHGDSNAMKWGGSSSGSTAGTAGGTVSYYFDPASHWTAEEQQVFGATFALWSAVANINFVSTTSATSAQIMLTRGSDGSATTSRSWTGSPAAGIVGGTLLLHMASAGISIDTSVYGFGPITDSFSTAGGYVRGTITHEIGHALGLGHSGPYDTIVDPQSQQFGRYDTTQWSIMSYISPWESAGANGPDPMPNWGNDPSGSGDPGTYYSPTTWMPIDLLAAQRLYGLPSSTPLSGGQTFGFNCNITGPCAPYFDFTKNTHPVITLWDKGGNNTLDVSGFSDSANINLNPGTFSSCAGMTENIAIAFDTAIDRVVLGSGSSRVTCNNDGDTIYTGSRDTTVYGGAGGDTIYNDMGSLSFIGGSGDDCIYDSSLSSSDGGAGNDKLVIDRGGSAARYSVALRAGYSLSEEMTDWDESTSDTNFKNYEHFSLTTGTGDDWVWFFDPIYDSKWSGNSWDAGTGYDTVVVNMSNSTTPIFCALQDTGYVVWQVVGGVTQDIVDLTSIEQLNIYGGSASDAMHGTVNADYFRGGGGDDVFFGSPGNDDFRGEDGSDTVDYSGATGAMRIDLSAAVVQASGGDQGSDQLSTIENVVGSGFADWMIGDGSSNLLQGGAGNDTLSGGAGNDMLDGGAGDETLTGGEGNDTLDGGSGLDAAVFSGARSAYTVTFNDDGSLTVSGPDGTDRLTNIETLKFDDLTMPTTAPRLVSTTPADNAKGVALGTDLILTFDKNVVAGTGNICVREISGGALVAALSVSSPQVSIAGATVTIELPSSLVAGVGYYVTIDAGMLRSSSGISYDGISGATTFNFSTIASTIRGDDGPNTLTGASGENIIYGLGGNDTLSGGAGDDTLNGGAGADAMRGGSGDDVFYVDNAGDVVTEASDAGNDTVRTTLASYSLTANVENLSFTGSGAFTGNGNTLNNIINGGSGNDRLDGKTGADILRGGAGDDGYYVDNAGDVVTEGANAGNDTVRTTLASYTLAANVENLSFTGSGSFKGNGNTLANVINGGTGSDTLDGKAGADTMRGGAGDDAYHVDNAGDVVTEGANAGNDTVRTTLASYTLAANVENLSFIGSGSFTGNGNTLANIINGGSGNDTLNGKAGADTMRGGAGDDVYYADNTGDIITEYSGAGNDVVRTTLASYTLGANVEYLSFIGSGAFTGTGNALANIINGGAGNDTIRGNGGADRLNGGAGADTYVYGAASESSSTAYDTIVGFDAAADKIDTWTTVTGIDAAITTGTLSSAGFDANLAAALGGHLNANHAILFTPNGGTLSGHKFLIVDTNGTAGYQAGADLVFELVSPANLSGLVAGTFC